MRVAYTEVFGEITELHLYVDLVAVKEEFLPPESSTPTNDAEKDEESETEPQQDEAIV